MNIYVRAIFNRTHYPIRLIENEINAAQKGILPTNNMRGTMIWDIHEMYGVLKEYEQLLNQMQNN